MGGGQKTAAPETVPYLRRSLHWVRPGRLNQVYLSSGEVYHKGVGQVIFHFRNIQSVGLEGKCTCCEQQGKRSCEVYGFFHTETPHSSRLYSLFYSTWLAKRMLTTWQVMVMHILMLVTSLGVTTTGRYGFHLSHSSEQVIFKLPWGPKETLKLTLFVQCAEYQWKMVHLQSSMTGHVPECRPLCPLTAVCKLSFNLEHILQLQTAISRGGQSELIYGWITSTAESLLLHMLEFIAGATRSMAPNIIRRRGGDASEIFESIDAVASVFQIF